MKSEVKITNSRRRRQSKGLNSRDTSGGRSGKYANV